MKKPSSAGVGQLHWTAQGSPSDAGVIRVERSWDPKARRAIEPKSRAGERSVPLTAVLRELLIEHKLASGRSKGLAFGRTATQPFADSAVVQRAKRAWTSENTKRLNAAKKAGKGPETVTLLAPIGMHECRHTFASLMIAAGVNAKALSTYMGHSNIAITMDRYGHLMPGAEDEAAALLDAYLQRADTAARVAQLT